MDQSQTNVKQRSCFKCGYFAATPETACPNCGRRLHTTTSVRVRGGILIACGVILIGMMSSVLAFILNAVNPSSASQAKFTGTHEQLVMMLGLFGLLILFGLFSLVTGLWQLIVGRRNKIFAWAVVGIGILIYLGGMAVIWRF